VTSYQVAGKPDVAIAGGDSLFTFGLTSFARHVVRGAGIW
jgi:hypothetical protein